MFPLSFYPSTSVHLEHMFIYQWPEFAGFVRRCSDARHKDAPDIPIPVMWVGLLQRDVAEQLMVESVWLNSIFTPLFFDVLSIQSKSNAPLIVLQHRLKGSKLECSVEEMSSVAKWHVWVDHAFIVTERRHDVLSCALLYEFKECQEKPWEEKQQVGVELLWESEAATVCCANKPTTFTFYIEVSNHGKQRNSTELKLQQLLFSVHGWYEIKLEFMKFFFSFNCYIASFSFISC